MLHTDLQLSNSVNLLMRDRNKLVNTGTEDADHYIISNTKIQEISYVMKIRKIIWGLRKKNRKLQHKIYYSIKKPSTNVTHKIWTGLPNEKVIGYKDAIENSQYLFRLMQKSNTIREQSILELGTNIGRNLNFLQLMGFSNLNGIEINPNAVKLMKKNYPELQANVKIGSLESTLKDIPTNHFDLVFSMAVLMHINPNSDFIFKEIARISKKFVIIIEKEDMYYPPSIFPRNYYDIFTRLGMEQTFSEPVLAGNFSKDYSARIFMKVTN